MRETINITSSHNHCDGMTLIEVTIAIAILSVLALAVATTIVPVTITARDSADLSAAVDSAEDFLEKIQALPYDRVVETYPDGKVWPANTACPEGTVTISYEDPTADLLVINVIVNWTDQKNEGRKLTFQARKVEN
jgi:prepilin-type N-terminal cleavage/methylation domain-containing protein